MLLLGVYRRDQHSSVAGINMPLLLGSTHLPRDYEILFRGSDDLLSGEDELRFDEERRTTPRERLLKLGLRFPCHDPYNLLRVIVTPSFLSLL